MLAVLSAGAAQAVVNNVAREAGLTLAATFGAVGVIRDRLMAGDPCDVIVLTQGMTEELVKVGQVAAEGVGLLGRVSTGVAVKEGAAPPDISTAASLRAALLGADAIYVPDLRRSTAGRHIAGVLDTLGLSTEVGPRIQEFPNGAAAMRAMADAHGSRAIGCTQASEILYTEGAILVGALPDGFELATDYAAAVTSRATDPAAASRFVSLLTGNSSRALRLKAGFEVAAAE